MLSKTHIQTHTKFINGIKHKNSTITITNPNVSEVNNLVLNNPSQTL